jgi:hypothetical protein
MLTYNYSKVIKEYTRELKDLGTRQMPCISNPEGDLMITTDLIRTMKKPIRLLGVVFQIDKECP